MTTLPNIPTDNLYKFIFIAGLTLILSGIILFTTQYNIIKNKTDELKFEIAKINSESKFLEEDALQLKTEIQNLKVKLNKIKTDSVDMNRLYKNMVDLAINKNNREYFSFVFEHKEDLIPYYNESKILDAKDEEQEIKFRQMQFNSSIILLKIKQLRRDKNDLIILCIIVGFLLSIGYALSRNGYKKWYYLVQKPIDEKIQHELRQLKSETK